MIIFYKLKCQRCGVLKTSSFKTYNGKIVCVDCSSKKEYLREIDLNNTSLEGEMVLNFLEQDIEYLYPIVYTINETSIDQFLTSEGIPDPYKLYFQGNDLCFCTSIREKAYSCLEYIETNEEEYLKFSEDFIKEYLSLRFKKLNSNEIGSLIEKANSLEFSRIEYKIRRDT